MFVSFAHRTAQGTATGGPLSSVPTGADIEATLGARMALGSRDAANVFLITGDHEAWNGPSDQTVQTMRSWGVTTVSATLVEDRAQAASNPGQQKKKKKKKSLSNLWGLRRHSPAQAQLQALLGAAIFHFVGSALELRNELEKLASLGVPMQGESKPIVVWEPSNLSLYDLQQALPLADIASFSPNTLAMLFGSEGDVDEAAIEGYVGTLMVGEIGPSGKGIILVRSDEKHLVATKEGGLSWTPTFHTSGGHRYIHRAGTASVFAGAFAIRFVQRGNAAEAALAGSVAESFAQEQVGLPSRDPCPNLSAQEDYAHASYGLPRGRAAGNEVWNLVGFEVRVRELRERIAADRRHQQSQQRRLSGETITDEM
ncbi:hypothetical protein HYQ45_017452 [Verticillium longisporum]|uniref:Carbohydrate kinase PfkB domain-containing protein n=1 Tax=Verticillium longisporum TaxID=100787 RepID=A0A8I2Z2F5_VERLO|nr:hypothetical protein HYQ45_017452 [Verticillium longisporum]